MESRLDILNIFTYSNSIKETSSPCLPISLAFSLFENLNIQIKITNSKIVITRVQRIAQQHWDIIFEKKLKEEDINIITQKIKVIPLKN